MPRDLLPNVPNAPTDLLPGVPNVPQAAAVQPPGLLTRIAQSPAVRFLGGAEAGAGATIGNVLRSVLRDIPTQTTRQLAQDIAGRQAATRREFLTPGTVTTAGEVVGGLAPLLAASPFAPEALGAETGPALAARLGTAAAVGATQAPRQQLTGALLGLAGGAGGEAIPALLSAGKRTVQAIGATSLEQPIRDEIKSIMTNLRKGVTGDNMNSEVFDKMKQAYQEVKGTKLVGKNEVPLDDLDYINRNPTTSVRNLFASAARLGSKNVQTYDRSSWDKELFDQIKANQEDLERAPRNQNALEVKNELRKLERTRLNNYKDAKLLREDINDVWVRGSTAGNNKLSRITGPLKAAVDQSMRDSAEGDTGDSATLKILTQANNAFKNELIPYEKIGKETSPFIQRYTGQKPSDKLIESYVRRGQPERLRLFLNQLPDDDARNLVTAHLFAPFEDDPVKFMRTYEKLQQPERNLLFPTHKNRLDELELLFKQHPSAFPTKFRDQRGLGEQVAKGLGVGLGGFGLERLVAGQRLQALALASPLILRSAIRGIAKVPSVRERLFQSLIRQTAALPRHARIASTLLPAGIGGQIAQQLGGQ